MGLEPTTPCLQAADVRTPGRPSSPCGRLARCLIASSTSHGLPTSTTISTLIGATSTPTCPLAQELGARSAVDIGCGTGTFACLLANEGLEVVGVDPAAAMLAVARRKVGADLVRWVHGVAADLPPMQVDLATMTGNVAQVFLEDHEWAETLEAARRVLRPGGSLVFESRRPERKVWLDWNPDRLLPASRARWHRRG